MPISMRALSGRRRVAGAAVPGASPQPRPPASRDSRNELERLPLARADGLNIDPQTLVVRGSLSAMAGFLVRLGARMLFLMLAARLYGVALFGAFSLATAAVEFAVAIAGLGNKRLIFKWLDERRAERPPGHVLVDAALLVIAAGATLAGTIMAAALLLPGLFLDGAAGRALLLVAPMIIGQALLDLLLAATRWHH